MVSRQPVKECLGKETNHLMSEKVLLRVDEAAAALGVGRSFLYGLVQRGEIASIKLGRARRIPVSALEEFIWKLQTEEEAP
jgi:excisionase family DNA binding protein